MNLMLGVQHRVRVEFQICCSDQSNSCSLLQGFLRVYEDMPDICLDVPLAYTVLERFVERCQKGGFLSNEVIKKMPSRFVYETVGMGISG